MAFKSKDGKREFSMSSRARAYDRGHPAESHRELKATATEPPDDGGEVEDGHALAEAHGPASEVHVTHDDAVSQGFQKHHVHSVHPDGHEHHSDHPDRKTAHEHAAKLAYGHPESPEVSGEEGTTGETSDEYEAGE